jgi:hypothetical protein
VRDGILITDEEREEASVELERLDALLDLIYSLGDETDNKFITCVNLAEERVAKVQAILDAADARDTALRKAAA